MSRRRSTRSSLFFIYSIVRDLNPGLKRKRFDYINGAFRTDRVMPRIVLFWGDAWVEHMLPQLTKMLVIP